MVFYYESLDKHIIYMGKDKHENEDLIEFAWKEDVWFHVDNFSSAHVYLRLNEDEDINSIDKQLLEECCQWVRFNSIEGSKRKIVNVVYTMASNLLKTHDMDVGTVGYKNSKQKIIAKNVTKEKDIYKRLFKTQDERFPDLKQELINRENIDIKKRKEQYEIDKKNKKEEDIKKFEIDQQNKKDFDDFNNYNDIDHEIDEEDDFL